MGTLSNLSRTAVRMDRAISEEQGEPMGLESRQPEPAADNVHRSTPQYKVRTTSLGAIARTSYLGGGTSHSMTIQQMVPFAVDPAGYLLAVLRLLLSCTFDGERLFQAFLLSRFQKEGVLLGLADNIFLLHFSLKTAQSAFQRFAVLNVDRSQLNSPPFFFGYKR